MVKRAVLPDAEHTSSGTTHDGSTSRVGDASELPVTMAATQPSALELLLGGPISSLQKEVSRLLLALRGPAHARKVEVATAIPTLQENSLLSQAPTPPKNAPKPSFFPAIDLPRLAHTMTMQLRGARKEKASSEATSFSSETPSNQNGVDFSASPSPPTSQMLVEESQAGDHAVRVSSEAPPFVLAVGTRSALSAASTRVALFARRLRNPLLRARAVLIDDRLTALSLASRPLAAQLAQLTSMAPAAAAGILSAMDDSHRAAVLAGLEALVNALVLGSLRAVRAAALAASMSASDAAMAVSAMTPRAAVNLLRAASPQLRTSLLAAMTKHARASVLAAAMARPRVGRAVLEAVRELEDGDSLE